MITQTIDDALRDDIKAIEREIANLRGRLLQLEGLLQPQSTGLPGLIGEQLAGQAPTQGF